ncbi:MAG TPA: FAD-binding protein, partial [Gammaproteobacteria bacterium]|nr:FAD-binding protein [Gammaproteobacteria bacterium]
MRFNSHPQQAEGEMAGPVAGRPQEAVDQADLERRLQSAVSGEVRFDAGSRGLYAKDGSNYRQPPIGVVVPRTVDDVVAAVGVCHHQGVPVLSRGAGTSLGGQCCNTAVVLDMSKYLNRVLDVDPERRVAR